MDKSLEPRESVYKLTYTSVDTASSVMKEARLNKVLSVVVHNTFSHSSFLGGYGGGRGGYGDDFDNGELLKN